ncbi:MAG: adenylate kinase [Clostridia bacterium]|nr:adenylate kinase [Clostridia bacterium]
MIILIAGSSRTGKTLLAQRMLEKYKYPYLSIDHLKMGLIRSGYTNLSPEDDNPVLTAYLWPVVREIIKTAVENNQNLIVEGCYIPFDWRRDFDERYQQSIRFVCLAMTDEYVDAHYDDILRHESEIESRPEVPDCTLERLKACNRYFVNGFRARGEEVFMISSDYEQALSRLLDGNLIPDP